MKRANRTSFQPGGKRSAKSIAKQKRTIRRLVREGKWVSQTREAREKNSRPMPQRAAKKNRAWVPVGTRSIAHNGYVKIKVADPNVWVYEHRLVAAERLGRALLPGEQVHHLNFDKQDNLAENLVVMSAARHNGLPSPDRAHPRCPTCGYRHPRH